VYKNNLARSVIQVEATERGEGTLTLRLRHKKHNFGPLAEPFGATLTFGEEEVALEPVELEAAELAEEATLNATNRVKLALEQGPAYPWEIAESTGLAVKTVKNTLTGLRKQGLVEPTGEMESRTEQVQLSVPASLAHKRDGDETKSDSKDVQDDQLEESVIEREPTGTPQLLSGEWEEV
jgi:DNA-binding CsgD family transcriptional regulator